MGQSPASKATPEQQAKFEWKPGDLQWYRDGQPFTPPDATTSTRNVLKRALLKAKRKPPAK